MYGPCRACAWQTSMLALESDRSAIQGSQSLQPLAGDQVVVLFAASIWMQHQHAAPVSLLELDQFAVWPYAKNLVEVQKI